MQLVAEADSYTLMWPEATITYTTTGKSTMPEIPSVNCLSEKCESLYLRRLKVPILIYS